MNAAPGTAAAILKGEREADEILAGAAAGAVVGTGKPPPGEVEHE